MGVRMIAAAVAVLLIVAAAAGFAAARPVRVVIDGSEGQVPAGTTVGELRDHGALRAHAGDLVGVDGSILATGSGEPPIIESNGGPARPWQRVYAGDVLSSGPGADRRESLVETHVAVPYKTLKRGSGSIWELRTEGKPGVRRVTRGAISGTEVSSTVLIEPVNAVVQRLHPEPGAKIVALTFDDGPWPGQTDRILDVLQKQNVHATFFMLGARVKLAPVLAKRVVDEGHLAGNHTLGHKSIKTCSAKEGRRQIAGGRKAIEQATGVDTRWLRPPYGAMDAGAWKVVKKEKARVVMWNVDSHDWEKPGSAKIVASVVRDVRPGSVVLFHDGGGNRAQTVKALPGIIKRLKAKGYVFVTVDELIAARRSKTSR